MLEDFSDAFAGLRGALNVLDGANTLLDLLAL
jgi:hypothetical protein